MSILKFPTIAADIVILTFENGDLKVLLIKRAQKPFQDNWALPGGFLHDKETTQTTAQRILKDKAGVSNVFIEQLYTFDDLRRDPRGRIISVVYFALAPIQDIKIRQSPNIQTPTFFSIKKLPSLAFDHKKIIQYAHKRLQSKLEYTNAVFSLLPRYFSFNQLQGTYEAILGRKLDKRNFRKKFEFLGLIKPTKKVLTGNRQRPARLYTFVSKKPVELKKFF
jgi:8-oxo-dGTP diphosphatase